MIFQCEANGVTVEISAGSSRGAASKILNGEYVRYISGNQTCNIPEIFTGVKTREQVMVTLIGKDRIAYKSFGLNGAVADLQIEMITNALKLSGGNKTKAASLLCIKRSTLVEKIRRYQIKD